MGVIYRWKNERVCIISFGCYPWVAHLVWQWFIDTPLLTANSSILLFQQTFKHNVLNLKLIWTSLCTSFHNNSSTVLKTYCKRRVLIFRTTQLRLNNRQHPKRRLWYTKKFRMQTLRIDDRIWQIALHEKNSHEQIITYTSNTGQGPRNYGG